MAALGALIGGGVFELFPRLRAAIIETGGGWMPLALDRLDTHYLMSPGHGPNLQRMPREVLAEGRYFHGIDSWERSASRNWARTSGCSRPTGRMATRRGR